MNEAEFESLPDEGKAKVVHGMQLFHKDFLAEMKFKPARLLAWDSEYQFVTNEDESLILFLPTAPIMGRKNNP